MEIADVGCGPGYFTLPVVHMTKGTVYAVDVSPEMLDILHERAEQEGLSNISLVESPASRSSHYPFGSYGELHH